MAFLSLSPEIASVSVGIRDEIAAKLFCKTNPRNGTSFRSLRDKEKVRIRFSGARVRVCSCTKDCEVRESGCEENASVSLQLSAPVKHSSSSSSKQKKEEEEKQNYYINTGYAIRILREDVREIFYRDPCFDIYRDDIIFKDPLNTFVGIENYKLLFWALRFHGKVFFKALWVDIISMSQPVESVIMVRWTVHGIPRVPWDSRGRFDATSMYKLDKNGKIFEHRVDNIAFNSPPKFRVLAVEELIQNLGCPSTPWPTYFESLFHLAKSVPFLVRLLGVRYHHLGFIMAFALRCAIKNLR